MVRLSFRARDFWTGRKTQFLPTTPALHAPGIS